MTAWAVVDKRNRIEVWYDKDDREQLEIFESRRDARAAAKEWNFSDMGHKVVRVNVEIIR